MTSIMPSSERCQKMNLLNSLCLQSQPHMENVIVIMLLTEFWSRTLFLSASTPFCKPGSCRLILASLGRFFPPLSLTFWTVNNRFRGFITYTKRGEIRIPKFIVTVRLCVLLPEVLGKFQCSWTQETRIYKSISLYYNSEKLCVNHVRKHTHWREYKCKI